MRLIHHDNIDEHYYKEIEDIEQAQWEEILLELRERYSSGLINSEVIEVNDKHFDFIGSILKKAMQNGLKQKRSKWYIPYYQPESCCSLAVQTTFDKMTGIFHWPVLTFGYDFSHKYWYHFFIEIHIPSGLFTQLHKLENQAWKVISELFSITDSEFVETISHEKVPDGSQGKKYGFQRFIKYIIATEIAPFGEYCDLADLSGDIALHFDPQISFPELLEKLAMIIALSYELL